MPTSHKYTEVLSNYHGDFCRTLNLTLPSFMTVDMWRRHDYSLADIHTTLKYFNACHLWQCALNLGIQMSGSSIRLSFSTPDSMVYGSKSIAIKKILQRVKEAGFRTKASVLDTDHVEHIPPLPVHYLGPHSWERLHRHFHNRPVDYLGTNYFDGLFEWNQIKFVPLWKEDQYTYAVRVVEPFPLASKSLATQPLKIEVAGQLWFGIEESCFFAADTPKTKT